MPEAAGRAGCARYYYLLRSMSCSRLSQASIRGICCLASAIRTSTLTRAARAIGCLAPERSWRTRASPQLCWFLEELNWTHVDESDNDCDGLIGSITANLGELNEGLTDLPEDLTSAAAKG